MVMWDTPKPQQSLEPWVVLVPAQPYNYLLLHVLLSFGRIRTRMDKNSCRGRDLQLQVKGCLLASWTGN